MACSETVCTAVLRSDSILAADAAVSYRAAIISEDSARMDGLCQTFDLIVLAYSPATSPCGPSTLVLTAQDLALRGAAEIRPNPAARRQAVHADDPPPRLIARHAVAQPLRPWHDHRRYSRAARNLAPRS